MVEQSRTLQLVDDLLLPLEAVTETYAILAKRGAGSKTHSAAVMEEEFVVARLPVCVIDPGRRLLGPSRRRRQGLRAAGGGNPRRASATLP